MISNACPNLSRSHPYYQRFYRCTHFLHVFRCHISDACGVQEHAVRYQAPPAIVAELAHRAQTKRQRGTAVSANDLVFAFPGHNSAWQNERQSSLRPQTPSDFAGRPIRHPRLTSTPFPTHPPTATMNWVDGRVTRRGPLAGRSGQVSGCRGASTGRHAMATTE